MRQNRVVMLLVVSAVMLSFSGWLRAAAPPKTAKQGKATQDKAAADIGAKAVNDDLDAGTKPVNDDLNIGTKPDKADKADLGIGVKPGATSGSKKEGKPAKDPVASAFAIRRGTVLNDKQQKAYDKLKADKEPKLRAALEAMDQAKQGTDTGAKNKAAKDVRLLRKEITTALKQILNMPYDEAQQKANAQMVKQAQALQKQQYQQWLQSQRRR